MGYEFSGICEDDGRPLAQGLGAFGSGAFQEALHRAAGDFHPVSGLLLGESLQITEAQGLQFVSAHGDLIQSAHGDTGGLKGLAAHAAFAMSLFFGTGHFIRGQRSEVRGQYSYRLRRLQLRTVDYPYSVVTGLQHCCLILLW